MFRYVKGNVVAWCYNDFSKSDGKESSGGFMEDRIKPDAGYNPHPTNQTLLHLLTLCII